MAIKVNGTNVITDSRALNNITSIDTTTKNAIGNAGVGGATSLIQSPTSVGGSASTKTFSLSSSYDVIYLYVNGVQAFTTDSTSFFFARLKDSSNNPITSSNSYLGGSKDSGRGSSDMDITGSSGVYGAYYASSQWQGYFSMMMRIQHHNTTNMQTQVSGWTIGYRNQEGSWGTHYQTNFSFNMRTTAINNSVYIYETQGYSIGNGTYSMYGVNL